MAPFSPWSPGRLQGHSPHSPRLRLSTPSYTPFTFAACSQSLRSAIVPRMQNTRNDSTPRSADALTRRRLLEGVAAAALAPIVVTRSASSVRAQTQPAAARIGPLSPSVLPAGVRSRFVDDVNGLRMHVLEAGYETPGRPAVLMIHGFPGTGLQLAQCDGTGRRSRIPRVRTGRPRLRAHVGRRLGEIRRRPATVRQPEQGARHAVARLGARLSLGAASSGTTRGRRWRDGAR